MHDANGESLPCRRILMASITRGRRFGCRAGLSSLATFAAILAISIASAGMTRVLGVLEGAVLPAVGLGLLTWCLLRYLKSGELRLEATIRELESMSVEDPRIWERLHFRREEVARRFRRRSVLWLSPLLGVTGMSILVGVSPVADSPSLPFLVQALGFQCLVISVWMISGRLRYG